MHDALTDSSGTSEGASSRPLRTRGAEIVDSAGTPLRLTGVGLGGWLNMENFITGYPGTEAWMRSAVRRVLGTENYELFFDRLLTAFFDEDDVRLLAELGLNCVRIPVNYRHFEDDERPFELVPGGFAQLDRVVDLCGRHGIYTVIDLHALPGAQNHHWHSDNPTHVPGFWHHPHFRDRVLRLWEAIADHYKDNPWVAGYNPVNEPADESGEIIGPFYRQLTDAVRAVDPRHILFLDGNTYSTEFGVLGDPAENTVYTCHDYALAGFVRGGGYPGYTDGVWVDKAQLEETFLKRTELQRRTTTPVWVGEFGPVYVGDPARDTERMQILADQLEIYRRHGASWSLWTYKDVGLQGLVHIAPGSAYGSRFGDLMAKKDRLGVDAWGSTGHGVSELLEQVHALVAREFPGFDPYPFGARIWVETVLPHIMFAQPMIGEYAELFRGLGPDDLLALADSFALRNCVRREPLLAHLRAHH